MFQNVEAEEDRVDDRSVDDLLSFINGGNGGMHKCWLNCTSSYFKFLQNFLLDGMIVEVSHYNPKGNIFVY